MYTIWNIMKEWTNVHLSVIEQKATSLTWFKSINIFQQSYGKIRTLIRSRKKHYLLLEHWYWMLYICKTLSPFHPRTLVSKFCWNWLSVSGEDFKILSMCFRSLFRYYLPLEKERTCSFILKKTWILHLRMFLA